MEQNVLITGASRGIGAAAARRFGALGWNVALGCCRERDRAEELARELEALGRRALVVQGDLADSEQARRAVEQAERELGPLEALVCCAGVALPQQLITDTTDWQWRQVMGVDLDGVFYTLRAAVPFFVRRKRGAIVTVSSMWGVTGASCEAAYSAAKAGVIGLTRALAKELGPSHIRVNCVAPGVIDTEMNAQHGEETMRELRDCTPLGRIGLPEDVAAAVSYLVSDAASFVTGQVLPVNGGFPY